MRILVTGGDGLVGKSLRKILTADYITHNDFDLTHESDVRDMFKEFRPDRVIHLAARVGGIIDNLSHQAEYFDQNVIMNTLMVKYAHLYGTKRFLGFLSSCMFEDVPKIFPLTEDMIHEGAPSETNFSYAIAKRMLSVQINAYNKEYGTKYNYIIPCNLYGANEKDGLVQSHFLIAIIKKIYEANKTGASGITINGSGLPVRQFLFADDVARVIKEMVDRDITDCFNIATPESYSIDEMVRMALRVTKSEHLAIEHNFSFPDGQIRKDISTERFQRLFPCFRFTSLEEGIAITYNAYKEKHDAPV